jgi:hypothetical protein
VAPLVGDDLADAYRTGAAYLTESVAWACGHRDEQPTSGPAAFTSGLRLEEALRAFLAEQGTKHIPRVELWRLIGGTLRLRLTAHAIAGLPRACADVDAAASAAIVARADALIAWYERLSLHLGSPDRTVAPLSRPSLDGAGAPGDAGSRTTIWLREHLDHLAEHLEVLVDPANHLADVRRRPWWR